MRRGVRVRLAFNDDTPGRRSAAVRAAAAVHAAARARGAGRRAAPDPRLARPDAPQVRRARRRGGVDGLDQLDPGLLDARGERAGHGRLAGDRRPPTRATSSSCGSAAASARSGKLRRPVRRRRARLVLPRARARALAPHRQAHRRGARARADRHAAGHRRADPGRPQRGHLRRARRHRGRLRRDAGAPGLRPVGAQPRVALEGAAAQARARRVQRQALDPVRPGRRPRLHARQGHGGRRRRVPRLVQPLALGRAERRERARDRRPGAGRAAWRAWIDGLRVRYPGGI